MNVPLVVQSRCLKSFSVWILGFLRFEVRLLKRLAKLLLTQAWLGKKEQSPKLFVRWESWESSKHEVTCIAWSFTHVPLLAGDVEQAAAGAEVSGPMNGLKPMETDLFRNGSMIMQGFLMISWFSIFFPYFLFASNKSLVFLDVSLFLKHKKTSLPRLEHCDVLDGTTSCFIHFLVAGRSFKAYENLTWRWGISCITLYQKRMTLPLFGLLGSGRFGRGTGNSICTNGRSQRQLRGEWQTRCLGDWSKTHGFWPKSWKMLKEVWSLTPQNRHFTVTLPFRKSMRNYAEPMIRSRISLSRKLNQWMFAPFILRSIHKQ